MICSQCTFTLTDASVLEQQYASSERRFFCVDRFAFKSVVDVLRKETSD